MVMRKGDGKWDENEGVIVLIHTQSPSWVLPSTSSHRIGTLSDWRRNTRRRRDDKLPQSSRGTGSLIPEDGRGEVGSFLFIWNCGLSGLLLAGWLGDRELLMMTRSRRRRVRTWHNETSQSLGFLVSPRSLLLQKSQSHCGTIIFTTKERELLNHHPATSTTDEKRIKSRHVYCA